MASPLLLDFTKQLELSAAGEWADFWTLARSRMLEGAQLSKKYLELPISVRTVYEGYPVIAGALAALEQGWFQDASILADATFTDPRCHGVLNTRVNALFAQPLVFKYQGQDEAKDTPEEELDQNDHEINELKQLVVDVTKKHWRVMLPSSGIREFQKWGIMVNLGVGELEWDYVQCEEMETGEFYRPVMKIWNPQFVYWRWDTRSFWLIHSMGQVELHGGDGTWVLNLPTGHNHGWMYGAIRALGKLWLDRVFWQQDWARVEEKFALGIVKAWAPADGDEDDKTRFEDDVTNMPPETTLVLPVLKDGRKFDVELMKTEQGETSGGLLVARGQSINNDVEILLLGQNMTTEVTGSSGSKAAATVHNDVRADYLKADNENLSECIRTQILTPMVERNFKAQAERLGIDWRDLIPEVTWQLEEEDDDAAEAKAFTDLSTGIVGLVGQKVPIDVRAMLERHGIPVLPEGTDQPFGAVSAAAVGPDGKPAAPGAKPPKPGALPFAPKPKAAGAKADAKAKVAASRFALERLRARAVDHVARRYREVAEVSRNVRLTYEDKRERIFAMYRDTVTPAELRQILKVALHPQFLTPGRKSPQHLSSPSSSELR